MMDKRVPSNENLSISDESSATAQNEAPTWSSSDEPGSATPSDGMEIRPVPRGSLSSSATLAEQTNAEKALEYIVNCKPDQDIEIASTGVPTSLESENTLVTWDGDRDAENPKNFSCFVKAGIGVNIGLMNFVVSFAISIFSGALEPAGRDSSPLSETTFEYGVSLFILGLAFGEFRPSPAQKLANQHKGRPSLGQRRSITVASGHSSTECSASRWQHYLSPLPEISKQL